MPAIFNPYNLPSKQVPMWREPPRLVLPEGRCWIWRCAEPAKTGQMCGTHRRAEHAERMRELRATTHGEQQNDRRRARYREDADYAERQRARNRRTEQTQEAA